MDKTYMNGYSPSCHRRKMSESASTPVKRACDNCHRRKVKCISENTKPCKNCLAANLNCTYNAVPQKKGPKGSRAKILSELRETQRHPSGIQTPGRRTSSFDVSSIVHRTPGIAPVSLVEKCVDHFFLHMHPSQPVLHRGQVQDLVQAMGRSTEAYCLVTALCAFVIIQPNMTVPEPPPGDGRTTPGYGAYRATLFLDESLRVRKSINYPDSPTVNSIITSYFIFKIYLLLDKSNMAWFHLREATTLALIMGMNEEETYATGDPAANARKCRLFWLLFVNERAFCLQRHRPLTLQNTIRPPTVDDDPVEAGRLSGFLHSVNLYRPFDDSFVAMWNKASAGCTVDWLARLQQQLSEALPVYLEGTEAEVVDLRISQQWLRTMVWQLSMSYGFLSSTAAENALTFTYPIEVSREVITTSRQFSQQAMEVHGIGFIEKLFDVACTLTDVMACVPMEQQAFDISAREYLNSFIELLSSLRDGQSRFLPLLLAKVKETFPQIQPHPSLSGSQQSPTNKARVDELREDHPSDHNSPTSPFVRSPHSISPLTVTGPSYIHYGSMSAAPHPLPIAGPVMHPAPTPISFSHPLSAGAQSHAPEIVHSIAGRLSDMYEVPQLSSPHPPRRHP